MDSEEQWKAVKQNARSQAGQHSHKRSLQALLRQLSLFEKVVLTNSLILVGEALTGLWVTSHSLETHHYLIDTSFLVIATLLSLIINTILLRASFRPLFSLLMTMRLVGTGKTSLRANVSSSDLEIEELANTFNTMLDRLEASRREQAMAIFQAQEEERRRLALELHDESSQTLTASLVYLEILKQRLHLFPETAISSDTRTQLGKEMDYLAQLTQQSLATIRVVAQRLRPSVLDDLGFVAAIRWLAEDGRQRLGLSIALLIEGFEGNDAHTLPLAQQIALFRIAQESLTNVARYAYARHVQLSLVYKDGCVCLNIHDDGQGYEPAHQAQGIGIFGMRERISLLGGTLHIDSAPGQGTTVQAVLSSEGEM